MGPPRTFKMNWQVALNLLTVMLVGNVNSESNRCQFSELWWGDWFHSGHPVPVTINDDTISFKGTCVDSDKDRFLLMDRKFQCYRCLVIHEKHYNVLQYKETFCDSTRSLEHVCGLLNGDAQLHSMFRINGTPSPCPFPHTYTFTYNRGHAECSYPLSMVDACMEDYKMLFRYQACPDIKGTESTTEEFVCLGVWKEGSNRFLVGKSEHALATSDEDRYRCFMYDSWNNRTHSGFRVTQSGEATCNGLYSIYAGSRTLVLTRVDTSGIKCRFPSWMGGPHWHSLDGRRTLHVTRRNSTLRLTGHGIDYAKTYACVEQFASTKRSATYVTRALYKCMSDYQCVHLQSRDDHVLEVLMGKPVPVPDACHRNFYDPSSKNFTTFVSGNAESRECPGMGRYQVTHTTKSQDRDGGNAAASTSRSSGSSSSSDTSNSGSIIGNDGGGSIGLGSIGGGSSVGQLGGSELSVIRNPACRDSTYTDLIVGCSDSSILEIHNTCSHSEYSCHGSWEEAGRQYLVVTPISRSSKGVRRLCLVLDRGAGAALSLASSAHSCSRDLIPGSHGHIALNTTSLGGCEQPPQTSPSSALQRVPVPLLVALTLIAVLEIVNPIVSTSVWTY